tara:strand:- start:432 stop:1556 length:1125 start_codon:yes stop_codon:yes gene_type:complete
MSKGKISVLVFGLIIIFISGYSLGSPELPFNDTIKIYYSEIANINSDRNYETIDDFFYETDVDALINIQTISDIKEKQQKLIQFIWKDDIPNSNLPTIEKNFVDVRYENLSNLYQIHKYTVVMEYGVNSIAYLFIPQTTNNELVIYHQGHGGDFLKGYEMIDSLLQNNFSVIAFSMPLKGLNNNPSVDIPNLGKISLERHDNFQFLENDSFSPIKYFVDPIYQNLNHIENEYNFEKFHMIGISGGAWVTTLFSAIDDRIEKSFAVAGPLPRFLTVNVPGNDGDYELNNPPLYENANILELFILSSYGPEREHHKLQYKYDPCCYYGRTFEIFENEVKVKVDSLENGFFEIHFDETNRKHEISDESIKLILKLIQ